MLTCIACNSNKSDQLKIVGDDTYQTKSGKEVSFFFIKHASFEIKYDNLSIQVDPVGDYGTPTNYADFPKADFIIVTHEHPDHFDKAAIDTLSGNKTQVILNKNCAQMLGRGKALSNGETLKLRDDITIEAVPAYNTSLNDKKEYFHPKGRDNGYVLSLDGFRIYIAGDTEDIPEMSKLKDIDIAFLPCNKPYTMNPKQLANAANAFKPKLVYPYHFSETPVDEMKKTLEGVKIKAVFRNMN